VRKGYIGTEGIVLGRLSFRALDRRTVFRPRLVKSIHFLRASPILNLGEFQTERGETSGEISSSRGDQERRMKGGYS